VLGADLAREEIEGFPEVSELEVIRHFTRLSTWNYGVDTGLYPLGSCTMKYNARINEVVARLGLATEHPYTPQALAQGCLRILHETARCLQEITGMDAVSLQPAAGAQGELTGILMIHAYLAERGDPRKYILIPDSAHGTNPASVAISGYEVRHLKSNEQGCVDIFNLASAMDADVAGLDADQSQYAGNFRNGNRPDCEYCPRPRRPGLHGRRQHECAGGSGAARGFWRRCHALNLHKTFSTPHGGGGPGSGPVAVKRFLEPYLPSPVVEKSPEGKFCLNYDRPKSIGRVRAFLGNFGMAVRALAYMLANGPEGLRQTTEDAVLNANYIRTQLRDVL
jgi:glycine dehydrogenase subunit 2